jgi:hypothetical protein
MIDSLEYIIVTLVFLRERYCVTDSHDTLDGRSQGGLGTQSVEESLGHV